MTDMHGQNGRRLLAQPPATRFHEASHCAVFSFGHYQAPRNRRFVMTTGM
ncbi:hypothetical protein BOA00_002035 [Salmonella enterica subsp. enterica serovar Braenderup]|nr:hypothetical protein [Salmonella enterica subsp. enterica serovar Braenderup]